jgi:hypothetical protein
MGKADMIKKNVAEYLKNNIDQNSLYKILRILEAIGEDTKIHMKLVESLPNDFDKLKILDMLGIKPDFDLNIDPGNPKNGYMHLESCRILNKKPKIDTIDAIELKLGGFSCFGESILSVYQLILCNKILGRALPDKLGWLKDQMLNNGSFHNDSKYTFWGSKAMKLLGEKNTVAENFIKESSEIINTYNSFYVNYASKELGVGPFNQRATIHGLMKYISKDGGFSPTIGGQAQMYDTYRAVSTIHNLQFMQKRVYINYLRQIKEDIVKWIHRCETEEGFGWIPNEKPYVQPTYHALHTLHLLDAKPKYDHRKYLEKCQNPDGGFNGGEKNTPSSPLYTYYVLAGIDIISGKIDEEDLGL